jgi:GDP-L-fucose synthase
MNRSLNFSSKIYVAGHSGMVGSAIVRALYSYGYKNIVTRTHAELDLLKQEDVENFLKSETPDFIFLAAAKVGGINANISYPADFIYENLMVEANVINSAYNAGVNRILFLGSSCIYPRNCSQPMSEEQVLSGSLEPTNEAYAIAKIAGIELCRSYNKQYGKEYFTVMPTNLYGPNDNYDLNDSHVIPALLRKAHEAKLRGDKEMLVWGTGDSLREFLHVDDLADACVFLMEHDIKDGLFNVGYGQDISIREIAEIVAKIVGFDGQLVFDVSQPEGVPRKLLNTDKLRQLGWEPQISLHDGLIKTYADFISNESYYLC